MNDFAPYMNGQPVEAVLLDMDDTLFLEHSYVLSGIAAVADFLAPLTGEAPETITARISYRFLKFGRRQLFDSELGDPAVCTIKQIVDIYRGHLPQISLFEGAADSIEKLSQRYSLALVTDGAEVMQTQKVKALGLDMLIPTVVYCAALNAPKPQPNAFLEAAEMMGADPSCCVVIGDDPTADMAGAQAAGMPSIRVMTGRYGLLEHNSPHSPAVSTFYEAAKLLF